MNGTALLGILVLTTAALAIVLLRWAAFRLSKSWDFSGLTGYVLWAVGAFSAAAAAIPTYLGAGFLVWGYGPSVAKALGIPDAVSIIVSGGLWIALGFGLCVLVGAMLQLAICLVGGALRRTGLATSP